MSKLKLDFSGRRSTAYDELGAFVRVNTENGHVIISDDVLEALGAGVGDKVGITFHDGVGYIAQEGRGYKVGKNRGFSSITVGKDFEKNYSEQLPNGEEIVIVTVDTDKPLEAETQTNDGETITINVFALEFSKAEFKKGHDSDDAEEEAPEEVEETEEI